MDMCTSKYTIWQIHLAKVALTSGAIITCVVLEIVSDLPSVEIDGMKEHYM